MCDTGCDAAPKADRSNVGRPGLFVDQRQLNHREAPTQTIRAATAAPMDMPSLVTTLDNIRVSAVMFESQVSQLMYLNDRLGGELDREPVYPDGGPLEKEPHDLPILDKLAQVELRLSKAQMLLERELSRLSNRLSSEGCL